MIWWFICFSKLGGLKLDEARRQLVIRVLIDQSCQLFDQYRIAYGCSLRILKQPLKERLLWCQRHFLEIFEKQGHENTGSLHSVVEEMAQLKDKFNESFEIKLWIGSCIALCFQIYMLNDLLDNISFNHWWLCELEIIHKSIYLREGHWLLLVPHIIECDYLFQWIFILWKRTIFMENRFV